MFGAITYKRPVNLIVAVNIIAYAFLFFTIKPYEWHTLAIGLSTILLICTAYYIIIKRKLGDEYLFLIISMLISLGVMMIYRLDRSLGLKQIIWTAAGILLFLISCYTFIKIRKWHRFTYFYIGVPVLLYLTTLALGRNINGATNWLVIGGYSFQPSELSKILYIMFLACYFKDRDKLFLKNSHYSDKTKTMANKAILMLVTYLNVGFLILQREWGTAVLFFLIYLLTLYIYGKDTVFFIANLILTLPVGLAGYLFFYHIRVRIETWINPWADITGKGYQITQSLFAIGSGGFFGTGIGMGRPDMVPAVSTDFIFSAICEEMGTFTGAAVVLLYMLLAYRGFKIVLNVRDRFLKVLASGVTVMIGLQTFIIIGGVIKLIPLTGITLPFISYGGSSLTTSFITLGILQAVSSVDIDSVDGEADE
ncbi:MAG: FtsW/RodA/SpoVE family cell cycle protein [Bacillota bacterium]